jgi:F0F1-type ATP synthase delta subunit
MKKLTARQYAAAIDQVLTLQPESDQTALAGRVLKRLRRDRMLRLWSRVFEHLKNMEAVRQGRRRVLVEAPTLSQAQAVARQLSQVSVQIQLNPALQRGLAVTINDQRFDASLAGRLQQLRRSLLS